jgi:hypothetical protein
MKLHLVLKHKWFDMIKIGEKREEYREMSDYWKKRIWANRQNIESIVFHRGYTSITHERECLYVEIGKGRREWGGNPMLKVYVLRLGKEVKQ